MTVVVSVSEPVAVLICEWGPHLGVKFYIVDRARVRFQLWDKRSRKEVGNMIEISHSL